MSENTLVDTTFRVHQPIISDYARSSAEGMADVYRFVISTIQQPLWMTPAIFEDFKLRGSSSKFAFANKKKALQWIEDNHTALWYTTNSIYDNIGEPKVRDATLLSYVASLPCLGLVKGGFFLQCSFGISGCIDMHNLKRFKIDPNVVRSSRYKNLKDIRSRSEMIHLYMKLVDQCGGTPNLWADWCEYVSHRDSRYEDAVHVSRIHCDALKLSVGEKV